MHHHIVALERINQPLPDSFAFPPGDTYTLTIHEAADASQLRARAAPATILLVTTIKLTAEILAPEVTPHLQYIACLATGIDIIDLEACKKRGIRVTNTPSANLDSVSEHAMSLYFAGRRKTAMLDRLTRSVPSDWKKKGSLTGVLRFADGKPPLTCKDEVMGIIGYGPLGKRIAGLGKALGMQVLIASRKNTHLDGVLPPTDPDQSRVPFEDVLRKSTVLVLSLPRNAQTLNLLSTPEFEMMSPYTMIVNVARGGIVDEAALLKALQDGQISGYGTDVLDKEPAEGPEDCVLFSEEAKSLNITVSPHLAWFAGTTLANIARILKETVGAWAAGEPINVIV